MSSGGVFVWHFVGNSSLALSKRVLMRLISHRLMAVSRRNNASLSIEKAHDMVDNRWKVSVSGLLPAQKVTLQATVEESKMRFGSYANFVANQKGEINLDDNASLGGTYTGIDSMGLVWSMKQCPGQRSGLRLFKRDVTTPMDITLSLSADHLTEDELYATNPPPEPLASLVAHRWFLAKGVQRSEIKVGNVRGTMFTPPGTGPFPGVIDLFGTAGGQIEFRASLLASHGFKVLALPYFGYQDLPKTFYDVDFAYFQEAADFFSSQADVCPGIGVVGVSKGGEVALWMTVYCPQVSAVVNISGCPFHGVCPMKFGSSELPGVLYDVFKVEKTEEGHTFSKAIPFDESALVPIQKSAARVLILFGEDDRMNPPGHLVRYIDWLPESKRPDVELVLFPKTGHLIEPPYKPFTRSSFHILFRDSVVWGGEAKAHAQCEVIAWNKLLGFLRDNVGRIRNVTNSQL